MPNSDEFTITTSASVLTKHSMMSCIHIFSFVFCSLIEICQNTCFMVSPKIFYFPSIAVLFSRAVRFIKIGISFFLITLGRLFPLQ